MLTSPGGWREGKVNTQLSRSKSHTGSTQDSCGFVDNQTWQTSFPFSSSVTSLGSLLDRIIILLSFCKFSMLMMISTNSSRWFILAVNFQISCLMAGHHFPQVSLLQSTLHLKSKSKPHDFFQNFYLTKWQLNCHTCSQWNWNVCLALILFFTIAVHVHAS